MGNAKTWCSLLLESFTLENVRAEWVKGKKKKKKKKFVLIYVFFFGLWCVFLASFLKIIKRKTPGLAAPATAWSRSKKVPTRTPSATRARHCAHLPESAAATSIRGRAAMQTAAGKLLAL